MQPHLFLFLLSLLLVSNPKNHHQDQCQGAQCFVFFLFLLLNIYLFIWLCRVLVAACRLLSCGSLAPQLWHSELSVVACMWDLVPWPGIELGPPALGVQSLIRCDTRKVPVLFSSRNFMVSWFTFKSLIHFELIFVYDVRWWSSFILLHVAIQFSQHHLLKRLSSAHFIFLPPLPQINCPYKCGFIYGLSVLFH